MIVVTALDGSTMHINPDLIEVVVEDADTHLRLVNGRSYLVKESGAEITKRIAAYRQNCQKTPRIQHAIRRTCSHQNNRKRGR